MEEISFQLAQQGEIAIVLRLLKEAAIWMKEKGIDYWQDWVDPPSAFIGWIQSGFHHKEFYLVKRNETIIGCFRLQWNDEVFWGERKEPAGYIHSFTIDRKLAGQNFGKEVIKLIENICKQNNKEYLRLDCGRNLESLCHYYENIGFLPISETIVRGEKLILYEKRIRQSS
jgi:ribosomal protein S18 acetylase RimI-like enzyme